MYYCINYNLDITLINKDVYQTQAHIYQQILFSHELCCLSLSQASFDPARLHYKSPGGNNHNFLGQHPNMECQRREYFE